MQRLHLHLLSDSTGETLEMIAKAALAQFDGADVVRHFWPMVRSMQHLDRIMGEIAAKLADRIFLTDEESYNEDPQVIRDMIFDGIEKAHGAMKTTEVADRYEAIKKALSVAKKGDTVLITGMGHEVYRIVEGKRIPWNDAAAVREILDQSK